MTPESHSEPVTPCPGFLRTIGVLNLAFGGVLLLFGAGCLYTVGPFLLDNTPLQIDPALTQVVINDMRREMVETLALREQSARTAAEKQKLAEARNDLQTVRTDLSGRIDFGRVNANLPWLSRYLWLNLLSGPVLNLLTVVSGVGLIFLSKWGRTLAVWVAVLKIGRLIVLCGLMSFVVVPRLSDVAEQFAGTDFGKAFLRRALDQQDPSTTVIGTPAVRFQPDEMVRILAALGYGFAVMGLALGAIYPTVALIVLTRPAARAACSVPTTPPRDEGATKQ